MPPSGGGPTSSTTQTSNLPEYVQPYFTDLLNRTSGASQEPYQPYADAGGNAIPRLAGFGQDSQAGMEMTRANAGIGAGDIDSARNAMGGATQFGLGLQNFQPGSFNGGYQSASYAPTNISSQQVNGGFAPSSINSGYTGPGDYQERTFGADQVQAGRATTGTFDTAAANQYMSPYIDTVMDRQKDAAVRDFGMGQAGRDTQAIRSGAFGGSRAAIQQGLAEEALSRQVGDIDAQGRQAAYQQAMGQFNQDQARGLTAQGMTLDQSLRSQLANQSANMQAQQLSEQSNQYGFGQTEAGRQAAAQLGLTAQQATDASRRFGSELDMRGQLANQSTEMQAQQMREQSNQFGAQFADASNRFSSETALREQQMTEAARQAGAQLGLSGAQLAMSGGQGIAGLGSMSQQMAAADANSLMRIGGAQDALAQQAYDTNYQNYLNQRDYDRNQLQFYSSILRGVPVSATSETATFTNPNPASQIAGLGIAGAGAYRALNG